MGTDRSETFDLWGLILDTVISRLEDASVYKTHPLSRHFKGCIDLSFVYSVHAVFGNIGGNQLLKNDARKPVKRIWK